MGLNDGSETSVDDTMDETFMPGTSDTALLNNREVIFMYDLSSILLKVF